MVCSKLLKLWYGTSALYGLLTALAPKRSLSLSLNCWKRSFENVSELEPKPWYVRATRAAGIGLFTAGIAALALEERARQAADNDRADDVDVIEVDVDEDESAD
ncbi:hypothetical protein [Natronorubrum aibiense]|uniref:DUF6199 domain-containing protein n=1 Tax=Natronorubrum aibiense TaxID=348826 RepID=A0A5P9P4B5_9EURY|nr:hypothetical protein [Natronorubrum aibiense]QFU82817.1 hypothetical protein GCU68_09910 [Natronorubrum aibiense]